MTRRRILQGTAVAVVLLVAVAALFVLRKQGGASDDRNTVDLEIASRKIKPLHKDKAKPKSGEWLASHKEPGQTFAQYARSRPNRPTKTRKSLYLQPIGEFSKTHMELVQQTAELLSRFYNVPTKVLKPLDLSVIPKDATRTHPTWKVHQILSPYVLDRVLKPRRPKDAVAVMALTTSDLWPGPGWNFVFGQASLRERVGVWSLYRYGNPDKSKEDYAKFRLRMFKVALHESGHMLGIGHCIHYECLMNGSNHLAEMDSQPLWLCPQDARKVWWACNADPVKRYASLIEFAKKHDMQAEAAFWQRSLKALKAK